MKRFVLLAILVGIIGEAAYASTLDIYFIDVEGGQSTLIVTPAKETLLIDAGFPSTGAFQAKPGNPHDARDANRIVAAAHDAGVDHIDYLLITHFHADHDGGVVELSQLMPIHAFVDHDNVVPEAEKNVPGTLVAFEAYAAVRAKGRHLKPAPGDRLPLKEIDAVIVSSAGSVLKKSLASAGSTTPSCEGTLRDAQDPNENPRSTGILVQFGKFRFLDVGDLTGVPLHSLVCPRNLIGVVDAYLVAHHGGPDAADLATFEAFKPRVAIVNNGAAKGGAIETLTMLHRVNKNQGVWQLHRSTAAGDENFSDDRIANLDESSAHWLKLTANDDGSFRILNSRTGAWTSYKASERR